MTRAQRRMLLALVALLTLVAGCGPAVSPSVPTFPNAPTSTAAVPSASSTLTTAAANPLRVVDYTAPPTVTGRWAGSCSVRGALPDPRCTRPSGTERAKLSAMAAYSIPLTKRSTTELDHLVPLSLGGSNDSTDLWPEVSDIPGAGFRNRKDAVETRLLAAVCGMGARVSLPAAQAAIAHDWTSALATLGIR